MIPAMPAIIARVDIVMARNDLYFPIEVRQELAK